VPSLSKVAIRSVSGTKSVPPYVVTRATKSVIAAPSFYDGRGSVCASDASCTTKQKIAKRTTAIGFLTASPHAVRDAVAVAGVPYLLYFVPFCSIDFISASTI
jgi:hypothetical protein